MSNWTRSDRDFNFDIFGHLPLEVTRKIISGLYLPDVVRLRRVPKQCLHILTSDLVTNTLLRTWDPKRKLVLTMPQHASPILKSSIKLEHINAFCTGKAFKHSIWKTRPGAPALRRGLISYWNGSLVWMNKPSSKNIHMLRFPSQHQSHFGNHIALIRYPAEEWNCPEMSREVLATQGASQTATFDQICGVDLQKVSWFLGDEKFLLCVHPAGFIV